MAPKTEQTTTIREWDAMELSKFQSYSAIFAMSCGTFAFGMNEFLMAGLLPEIEENFDVLVSTAAWVTTSFMIGLATSSPLITAVTVNQNRKYLLMGLLTVLVSAAVLTALSPSFAVLMVARGLAACGHASYMGAGSYVAGKLVPEEMEVSAVSLFFTGLTLSIAGGVPLGTLFAEKINWRAPYWLVTGLSGLSLLGVAALVPKNVVIPQTKISESLHIFRKPAVWLAFGAAAFGYSGMLASHTYFTKMMINLAGYKESDIAWLTFVYGLGTALGNIFGGKMADKHLLRTVSGLLVALISVLLAFNWLAYYKVPATIALFMNGFVGFALVAPLMKYISSKAGEDGAVMASASSISAFGVGIGSGVYLGGLAIKKGFGYSSPNWVGAALTALGLLLVGINEYCCNTTTQSLFTQGGVDTVLIDPKTKKQPGGTFVVLPHSVPPVKNRENAQVWEQNWCGSEV